MYFIAALKKILAGAPGVQVEYRLACSGEFYRLGVVTADWRKSDPSRLLLDHPFPIFVVSRPFEEFPQELCVRLPVARITEAEGNFSRSILPDDDVIDDLCALLTLLSRRLITRAVKTRERHDDSTSVQWYQSEIPMPVIRHPPVVAWQRNPDQPVGVDALALQLFLGKFPDLQHAQEIVHAARLYKYALESIEDRADTAYLALISVVESLSNLALANFEPSEDEKVASKSYVADLAIKMGLNNDQARALAMEASKQDRWIARRFKDFLTKYCSAAEVSSADGLFVSFNHWAASDSEFKKAIGLIYNRRSKHTHEAKPFPVGIGVGTSDRIDIRQLPVNFLRQPEIPSAAWFERVVSIAARKFILGNDNSPFVGQ